MISKSKNQDLKFFNILPKKNSNIPVGVLWTMSGIWCGVLDTATNLKYLIRHKSVLLFAN